MSAISSLVDSIMRNMVLMAETCNALTTAQINKALADQAYKISPDHDSLTTLQNAEIILNQAETLYQRLKETIEASYSKIEEDTDGG